LNLIYKLLKNNITGKIYQSKCKNNQFSLKKDLHIHDDNIKII